MNADVARLVRRQHDLDSDGWHEAAAAVRVELAKLSPEAAAACWVPGSTIVRWAFAKLEAAS